MTRMFVANSSLLAPQGIEKLAKTSSASSFSPAASRGWNRCRRGLQGCPLYLHPHHHPCQVFPRHPCRFRSRCCWCWSCDRGRVSEPDGCRQRWSKRADPSLTPRWGHPGWSCPAQPRFPRRPPAHEMMANLMNGEWDCDTWDGTWGGSTWGDGTLDYVDGSCGEVRTRRQRKNITPTDRLGTTRSLAFCRMLLLGSG